MTGNACPTCGKPIDPFRAPSVKVIAGKITAFCSPGCAGRAATEPSMPFRIGNPVSQALPAMPSAPVVVAEAPAMVKAIAAERAAAAARALAAAEAAKAGPEPARDVVVKPAPAKAAPMPLARRLSRVATPPVGLDDEVEEPAHPPYDPPYDATEDSHDDGPGDVVELKTPKRRGRGLRTGRILAASAALIAGGGAIAVLSTLVSPSHPSRVDAETNHAIAPAPPAQPSPPPVTHVDPGTTYVKARAVLTELFASPSDRVRRVAAIALTRVGDKPALDYLAHALETESSAILRMQDAFAMARAGDKRGKDALTAGLQSPRRDVRSEAATGLLRLGDKAGMSFMTDLMQLDQNKIGAAGALAQMGDAKAIAALRAIAADPKAPREQHMRALIALAIAGQADVAPELRTHVVKPDDDQRVAVARALAQLGDTASAADAAAVLTPELEVESLRVEAAIALRRLAAHPGAKLDPVAWADHLAPALTSGRDTDQASAAEASLILLGPSTVAEHE